MRHNRGPEPKLTQSRPATGTHAIVTEFHSNDTDGTLPRRSTTWPSSASSGTPIRISARGGSRAAAFCSGPPRSAWLLRSPWVCCA
jgi:hypothetical protein